MSQKSFLQSVPHLKDPVDDTKEPKTTGSFLYLVQTRQKAGREATEEQQAKESYLAVSTITHKTQNGGKTPKCPG